MLGQRDRQGEAHVESQQADAHTQALLVEDNETLRSIRAAAFRDAGHGTTEAATLQDALGSLEVARLDVVVSVPHFPGGRADRIPDAPRQTGANPSSRRVRVAWNGSATNSTFC